MNRSIVLLVLAVLLLSGCTVAPAVPAATEAPIAAPVAAPAVPEPAAPAAAEPKVLRMNFQLGDVYSIDPALGYESTGIQVIEATTVGLVRLNEETMETEPGMAESRDVAADGKTYTFHLRGDVPWVRYDPATGAVEKVKGCDGNDRLVTAGDFHYGILRTLDPGLGGGYPNVLNYAIAGAQAYNLKETTDPASVGVKVVDDRTLEVAFSAPVAFNLNIISMWNAHAQPQWLIEGDACTEAAGERWTDTGNFQGYGPFTLKEWLHEASLSIVKNPFWPGTAAVPSPKVDEIVWSMLDQVPAFSNYEADLLDMVLVPLSDIDRVKSDPKFADELKIDANLASYYYGFNIKAPVVDDVRVRRALSMAVDRQDLVDNVTKGAEEPAQWFCRPGAAGCPNLEKYPDLGVKFDPDQAKALLGEYLAEKGQTASQLDITLAIASDSRHQRIAEAIQAMWKKHLDLDVKIMAQESKTYWVTVIDPVQTPQLWRNGWNADYPDANNFIFESFAYGLSRNPVGGGGTNWGKYEPFEEAIAKGAMETDPAARMDLYAQAEQILNWEQCVMIPIYWDSQVAVTKPYVQRTYSKIKGFEHHEKWDIVR